MFPQSRRMRTVERFCNRRHCFKFSMAIAICVTFTEMISIIIFQKEISHVIKRRERELPKKDIVETITSVDEYIQNTTKMTNHTNICDREIQTSNIFIEDNATLPTYKELEEMFPWLQLGGRYKPDDCVSDQILAVIIPYRNRDTHLRTLLHYLHPFLKRQGLEYGIYVINQAEGSTFNKAMLMNIGFVESLMLHNYNCFIFHDVDLLPEDDRNVYGCFGNPRHLSVAIDKFNYTLPYSTLFGGVIAMSKTEFERTNGFSNMYFGWGGEDDDMFNRVIKRKMKIVRFPPDIARYRMIKHDADKGNKINPKRELLLKHGNLRMEEDGINSLDYTLQQLNITKLYTWVSVKITETDIFKESP